MSEAIDLTFPDVKRVNVDKEFSANILQRADSLKGLIYLQKEDADVREN